MARLRLGVAAVLVTVGLAIAGAWLVNPPHAARVAVQSFDPSPDTLYFHSLWVRWAAPGLRLQIDYRRDDGSALPRRSPEGGAAHWEIDAGVARPKGREASWGRPHPPPAWDAWAIVDYTAYDRPNARPAANIIAEVHAAPAAALLLAVGLLLGLGPLLAARRRRYRMKSGLCLHCGYDLRGVEAAACPECGKPRALVTFHRGEEAA